MIATALAIADASKNAVSEPMILEMAAKIVQSHTDMTREELIDALFFYSATLSSVTASLVTEVCLTGEQVTAMLDEIDEFDKLGKEF